MRTGTMIAVAAGSVLLSLLAWRLSGGRLVFFFLPLLGRRKR